MSNTDPKVSLLEKWGVENLWARVVIRFFITLCFFAFCAMIFRIACVDFVDNYEIGYKFDTRTGAITILDQTGYIITPPILVKVHTIDLRPMQVCINANSRVLNCKLVQFNKEGTETFLSWHGRTSYSGSTSTLSEILKSYAFDGSGKSYPFLTVLRELKPEESGAPR